MVDSAFHSFEVDQMSTWISWRLGGSPEKLKGSDKVCQHIHDMTTMIFDNHYDSLSIPHCYSL